MQTFNILKYLEAQVPPHPNGNHNPKSQEQTSPTYYFDIQWQIYWELQTMAWAHLNQCICKQKKQLSRHTGALQRLQNKPCHLLRQVTGVMVNPIWLGASISLSQGKGLFLRCLKSQQRWKQGLCFSLYEFHPNNSRAHVPLGKSHRICNLCAGMS